MKYLITIILFCFSLSCFGQAQCCKKKRALMSSSTNTGGSTDECEDSNDLHAVCSEDLPFVWRGTNYTEAGSYIVDNADDDCRTTLILTVFDGNDVTDPEQSLCEADEESIIWNGQTITSSGTYTATMTDSNGCEYTATLVVIDQCDSCTGTDTSETIITCTEDYPYTWNTQSITSAGTYTASLVDGDECNYVATLTATTHPVTPNTNETDVVCDDGSETIMWNSQSITSAGTYTATLEDVNGCDYTATLIVTDEMCSCTGTDVSETLATCTEDYPYTWNSQTITTAGTYTASLVDGNGCNYTATLTATTLPVTPNTTETITTCTEDYPYTWNSQNITAAGSFTATLQDANGCDYTAALTAVTHPVTSDTNETDIVCDDGSETISWNGQSITSAGTYTATLTDSNQCDYTATLVVTEESCSSFPSECNGNAIVGEPKVIYCMPLTGGGWSGNLTNTKGCGTLEKALCDDSGNYYKMDCTQINESDFYQTNGDFPEFDCEDANGNTICYNMATFWDGIHAGTTGTITDSLGNIIYQDVVNSTEGMDDWILDYANATPGVTVQTYTPLPASSNDETAIWSSTNNDCEYFYQYDQTGNEIHMVSTLNSNTCCSGNVNNYTLGGQITTNSGTQYILDSGSLGSDIFHCLDDFCYNGSLTVTYNSGTNVNFQGIGSAFCIPIVPPGNEEMCGSRDIIFTPTGNSGDVWEMKFNTDCGIVTIRGTIQ